MWVNEMSQALPSRGSWSRPREKSLYFGVVGFGRGEPRRRWQLRCPV